LCIFLGQSSFIHSFNTAPSKCIIYVLRLICFRIYFEPGVGKIVSRDPSWWPELTAMQFHYWTQPSCNTLSWFIWQMPNAFHKMAVLANHFVELFAPFLIFSPFPLLRYIGAFCLIVFQIVLISVGNYSYLSYLSIAQVIPVLDDDIFYHIFHISSTSKVIDDRPWGFVDFLRVAISFWFLYLSYFPLYSAVIKRRYGDCAFNGWHLGSGYGAFSQMTRTRPELVILATQDDVVSEKSQWVPYEFYNKVGSVTTMPTMVAPWERPLEWSLWFVPLRGSIRNTPWAMRFLFCLLKENPDVLSLLSYAPPRPKHIRVEIWDYEFSTDLNSSAWWKRKLKKIDVESIAIEDFGKHH